MATPGARAAGQSTGLGDEESVGSEPLEVERRGAAREVARRGHGVAAQWLGASCDGVVHAPAKGIAEREQAGQRSVLPVAARRR